MRIRNDGSWVKARSRCDSGRIELGSSSEVLEGGWLTMMVALGAWFWTRGGWWMIGPHAAGTSGDRVGWSRDA